MASCLSNKGISLNTKKLIYTSRVPLIKFSQKLSGMSRIWNILFLKFFMTFSNLWKKDEKRWKHTLIEFQIGGIQVYLFQEILLFLFGISKNKTKRIHRGNCCVLLSLKVLTSTRGQFVPLHTHTKLILISLLLSFKLSCHK